MVTRMGNFLIDQWLWNITWDWYHIPLSMLLMIVFFRFFLRMDIVASVVIALSATVAASITFSLFVVGVLITLFNYTYQAILQSAAMVADPLHACIYVGIIYTIIQAIFFVILNRYYKVHYIKMIVACFVANMLSAGIIYLLLPNPLM